MGRYIINRIFGLIITMLVVSLFTFLAMHAAPGGPYDQEKMPLSPEQKLHILQKFGLDKPLYEQYGLFVWNAIHLDFGYPYWSPSETVLQFIRRTWPYSLQLGGMTFIVAVPLGLVLGVLAAFRRGTWIDNLVTITVIAGISVPSFILATVLILVVAVGLKLLPTGGWAGPRNWIMPVFVNSLGLVAMIARYTRTAVLEVISADYVRTAYSKGLKTSQVLTNHVLRNALIPVVASLGPVFPGLATGSVFIESIFRIPGLGNYFAVSITRLDYPLIMGTVLLFTFLVGFFNVLTDIFYTMIDPRVTLKGGR